MKEINKIFIIFEHLLPNMFKDPTPNTTNAVLILQVGTDIGLLILLIAEYEKCNNRVVFESQCSHKVL
jgi:hypothetical protein